MREIKFRVWVIAERKWGEFETFIGDSYAGLETRDDCIVQQYTGLKDKNGKEIYEGDVLDYYRESGIGGHGEQFFEELAKGGVVFKDGSFFIQRIGLKGLWAFHNNFFDMEVVGNICENPQVCR